MRRRKARIDSASEAVRVMSAAARKIDPPSNVPLDKSDLPFFASVIAEFARSEWTAHQLELAAMPARTMADLEREQRALRVEGAVVKSDKGTPVVNPRKAVVQMHAASILSFRRSLSLHAHARKAMRREMLRRDVVARRQSKQTILLTMDCWYALTKACLAGIYSAGSLKSIASSRKGSLSEKL
jgi:hypothetical protein